MVNSIWSSIFTPEFWIVCIPLFTHFDCFPPPPLLSYVMCFICLCSIAYLQLKTLTIAFLYDRGTLMPISLFDRLQTRTMRCLYWFMSYNDHCATLVIYIFGVVFVCCLYNKCVVSFLYVPCVIVFPSKSYMMLYRVSPRMNRDDIILCVCFVCVCSYYVDNLTRFFIHDIIDIDSNSTAINYMCYVTTNTLLHSYMR